MSDPRSRTIMTSRPPSVTSSPSWNLLLVYSWMIVVALLSCTGDPGGPAPIQVGERWQLHRSSPGHQLHLDQGLPCTKCHDTSGEELGRPTAELCVSCHDLPAHHTSARKTEECVACHQFAAPEAVELGEDMGGAAGYFQGPQDCLRCHHAPQGDHPAVTIHADQPCLSCHQPHGEKSMTAQSCTGCHNQVQLQHGARSDPSRPVVDQCLDCHRPHSEASTAGQACPTCHQGHRVEGAPQIPGAATFTGGHESCADCHHRHDLRASASKSCEGCHQKHPTLGAPRVAAHSACTSCHSPHNVKASAQQACARCHQDRKTDHPILSGMAGPCTSCHD